MKQLPVLLLFLISVMASSCNAQVDSKISDKPLAEQNQFIGPNAMMPV